MSVVMPFGKHKGKYLDEIDPGYLQWSLDNLNWSKSFALKTAIEEQLKSGGTPVAAPKTITSEMLLQWATELKTRFPDPQFNEVILTAYAMMKMKLEAQVAKPSPVLLSPSQARAKVERTRRGYRPNEIREWKD